MTEYEIERKIQTFREEFNKIPDRVLLMSLLNIAEHLHERVKVLERNQQIRDWRA